MNTGENGKLWKVRCDFIVQTVYEEDFDADLEKSTRSGLNYETFLHKYGIGSQLVTVVKVDASKSLYANNWNA